jgi:hypothetical protein
MLGARVFVCRENARIHIVLFCTVPESRESSLVERIGAKAILVTPTRQEKGNP